MVADRSRGVGAHPGAGERGGRRRAGRVLALAWTGLLAGLGPTLAAWPTADPPHEPPEAQSPATEEPARPVEEPAADDAFWETPETEEAEPVAPPPGDGADDAPPGFALTGDRERGRAIFARSCASCHGEDGSGRGRIALDPPARDLRDAARMGQRSDWEVYRVIRDGGKVLGLSARMIPWAAVLDESALHDVAVYVRSLAVEGGAEPAPAPAGEGQPPDGDGAR